ncbi:MAG: type II toxin-antitoxin system VapC family toxin [Polyangiaceae bacterium]|nr:type II toxin-antitoxin system VapC family toxin [Polyangiaceae bacterium]
MRVLLDTHVWLWWLLGSDKLPTRERDELDRLASSSALGIAAVTLWETQMLHAKKRLTLNRSFNSWIRDAAAPNVVQVLALDVDVVIALNELPASFHGDPADRLIVATARAHRLSLATHDTAIRRSRVSTLWKPG